MELHILYTVFPLVTGTYLVRSKFMLASIRVNSHQVPGFANASAFAPVIEWVPQWHYSHQAASIADANTDSQCEWTHTHLLNRSAILCQNS